MVKIDSIDDVKQLLKGEHVSQTSIQTGYTGEPEEKITRQIGDRWKDIEAGQRAGCQCFFIDNSYSEQRPTPPFHKVTSLLEAAVFITEGKNAT